MWLKCTVSSGTSIYCLGLKIVLRGPIILVMRTIRVHPTQLSCSISLKYFTTCRCKTFVPRSRWFQIQHHINYKPDLVAFLYHRYQIVISSYQKMFIFWLVYLDFVWRWFFSAAKFLHTLDLSLKLVYDRVQTKISTFI